jgi:hypothetical protein
VPEPGEAVVLVPGVVAVPEPGGVFGLGSIVSFLLQLARKGAVAMNRSAEALYNPEQSDLSMCRVMLK